ncbi:MAG: TonB-dependent receptor [Acidobacteria bacterium]|nr:TonB-dependent receptor [Acidobacteriota bacterium]
MSKLSSPSFLAAILLMLVPAFLLGQSFNATLNGRVTDPSGAVIPGAEVTLTNIAQQSEAKVFTEADGLFSFPNLKAGNYEIKVTAQGFKPYVQRGIALAINQIARLDVSLEIGEQTQVIEVSSNVTSLNFETPVREDAISPQTLEELPLLVAGGPRSSATFAILMPGVSTGATGAAYDARVNGGLTSGDEAIMDGVTMQQGYMSQNGMVSIYQDFPLTPDMVSELKIITANYEPQYGSTLSSAIVAVTKSGTSEFHGGGYEYHRNTVLNARQFGADKRPKSLQNDFGFHLGGPVKPPGISKIPGIYSDRSKAYFYVNYEAFRIAGGVNRPTLTVPTVKMKNGDFSEWVDGEGNLIPIYDPATVRVNPNFDSSLPEGPTNSRYLKNQFMGCDGKTPNVICPSDPRLQNSLAKAWLKYVPDPNKPGIFNNYLAPTPVPDTILAQTNYWLIKGDYYFRENDHFAATVWYQGAPPKYASVFPIQIASESMSFPQFSWVNRFNWDHTFSPNLLNHLSYGYLNRNEGYGSVNKDYADEFPKIKGVAKNDIPPTVGISGYSGYGTTAGVGGRLNTTARPTNVVNDLLTWVAGKHTWKFGAEVRVIDGTRRENTNNAGYFYFGTSATGLPGFNSGSGYASFLLGAVDYGDYALRTQGAFYVRQRGYIWHVGDTWKATPKLTLSLGLRWDYYTPSYEKYNRSAFLDPKGANPGAGGRPGRMAWGGNEWGAASYGARYPEIPWKKGWAPRVGFAYAVNDKTVVRAGYGIFYSQAFYPGWGGGIDPNGFNTTVSKSAVAFGGYAPAFYWQDGFPAPDATQIPPFINSTKQNGKWYPQYRPLESNRLAYAQQWNLTIERQFGTDTSISVAYVANKGTRVPSTIAPINVLDPKYLSLGAKLNDVFEEGMTSLNGVPVPYAGWISQLNSGECSPTVAQALLPYPQYCGNIQGLNENAGSSTYHSFQAKVERRFAGGLFLLASYTNSKLLSSGADNTQRDIATWGGAQGVISPYERQRNKALAGDDVPQVFSLALAYDLPFGIGKRWMNSNKVANAILGNWTISTVFRKSSGVPFYFRSGYCNIPGQFGMGCIPTILKNPFLQDPGDMDVNKPLFDKSAFEPVSAFNYYQGKGPRISDYRGQSYQNQDFALVKDIMLVKENVRMQLRAEFFNLWNWHIFNAQGGWGGSSFTTDINSPDFGMWNGSVTNPRNIQVGVRLGF